MKDIIIKFILVVVGFLSVLYFLGEPDNNILTDSIFLYKVLSFIVLLGCIVLWRVIFGDSDDNELA